LKLKDIGNTDPICPHCSQKLEKMPGRKKKCPHCGEYIFVRTRPSDRKKIIIREGQIDLIEEQWSIVNGNHEEFLAAKNRFLKKKRELQDKWGKPPSDNDVQWALYNEELLDSRTISHPGSYRNIRYQMGEMLRKEKRFEAALDFYLEIIYRDVNISIADNIFNPKSPICPGIHNRLSQILDNVDIGFKDLHNRFIIVNQEVFNLQKPLFSISPQKAWELLSVEISQI
jgi:DNA-directed RNA polymerase subunit RPC12/RpoP